MDFLDFLDVFFLFSSDKEDRKKRNGSNGNFLVVKILFLLATIAWCAYEFLKVVELTEPILFVSVFSAIGFLLTIVVIVVVWKLDWIEYVTPRKFLSYLVPIVLISVSTASFINRYYASERLINAVAKKGTDNESLMLKSPALEEFNFVLLKKDYPDLRQEDSIQLKYSEGLFGFDWIKEIKPAFQYGED